MSTALTKSLIRTVLAAQPSAEADDMLWLPGSTPEVRAAVRASLPAERVPAAVLVPLVERGGEFAVLLTQRARTLKDHAGQISFPGGRIEPEDANPWQAAVREAHEEIGLAADAIEFAGYLPDHLIVSGFRVTPVVGFVKPAYRLSLDSAEVEDAFEVPLDFLFDAANHHARLRKLGAHTVETVEIAYGRRLIWGMTASMLMALRGLVRAPRAGSP
jgi:8-oxo-dGTP pyrophosphatase MutT (NUDIX family)